MGRLFAGLAAVDKGNIKPPSLQLQGGRGSDHAGAKHDDVNCAHLPPFQPCLHPPELLNILTLIASFANT